MRMPSGPASKSQSNSRSSGRASGSACLEAHASSSSSFAPSSPSRNEFVARVRNEPSCADTTKRSVAAVGVSFAAPRRSSRRSGRPASAPRTARRASSYDGVAASPTRRTKSPALTPAAAARPPGATRSIVARPPPASLFIVTPSGPSRDTKTSNVASSSSAAAARRSSRTASGALLCMSGLRLMGASSARSSSCASRSSSSLAFVFAAHCWRNVCTPARKDLFGTSLSSAAALEQSGQRPPLCRKESRAHESHRLSKQQGTKTASSMTFAHMGQRKCRGASCAAAASASRVWCCAALRRTRRSNCTPDGWITIVWPSGPRASVLPSSTSSSSPMTCHRVRGTPGTPWRTRGLSKSMLPFSGHSRMKWPPLPQRWQTYCGGGSPEAYARGAKVPPGPPVAPPGPPALG
mmetsp:Transcript_32715/g.114956  ORF Transcript_32715/g.114956 Transcript_32715/m.114956 type:complete len:408 (+) Transcript_32715:250-1473(+)